jgi:hypothetical protein
MRKCTYSTTGGCFLGRKAGRREGHKRLTEHSQHWAVCVLCGGMSSRTGRARCASNRGRNNVDVFVSLRWYYPVQVPRVLSQPRLLQCSTNTTFASRTPLTEYGGFLNERRHKLTILTNNVQAFFLMCGSTVLQETTTIITISWQIGL